MTDSDTVFVVGTLPDAFDIERFESALGEGTVEWDVTPAAAVAANGTADCVVATVAAVERGGFAPRAVAAPVLLVGEEGDGLAKLALASDAVDYLAVAGAEAEAEWLAHRVRTASASYRTDRRRAQLDAQQQALSELGAFALGAPTREEVFDETVQRVADALAADRVALFQYRPSRRDLSMVATEGWPRAYVGGVAVDLDSGPGTALRNREPFVTGSLAPGTTPLTAQFPVESELSVVVGGEDRPWGVLTAHGADPEAFNGPDVRFVENVAALIAAVIQRETLRTTLEEVFDRIDQGLFGLDTDWRVTYMNPEAERLLDTTAGEFVGQNFWDLFDEDAGEPFRERYEHAAKTGEEVSFESYFPPHDRWYEVKAYPSHGGLSVYFADVTDRVEREMELLRYERMVEEADDGVYALDADQRVVEANEAFAEMFDRERSDLIGRHAAEIVGEGAADEGAALRREAAETTESKRLEFRTELPSGDEMWAEVHFSALVDDETGQFVGTVGVVRDVTERRHHEQSLTALHEWTREMARADDAEAVVERTLEGCDDLFDPCRAAFFDYDAAARALRRSEDSDPVGGSETVEPGDDPRWTAFAEERPMQTESDAETTLFVPVGRYGVLGVERPPDATVRETDDEILRLLAATMGELLGGVETREALRERDRRLEQQNERLTQLNRINRTVREVTRSVVTATTVEEATTQACERLVEAEPYQFAWLCEFRRTGPDGDPEIRPMTTSGGDEGYAGKLSEVAQTAPFDELLAQAATTGRRAVVNDVLEDPTWEPHRRDALARGFRSLAVVPAGEDRLLVVHGTRPETFVGEDGNVLVELGEVLGAVIDQLGRSRPILGDQQTEVELEIRDDDQFLVRLAAATGEAAAVSGVVPTADGEYRVFVRTAAPPEATREALPPGTVVRELTDEVEGEHLYEIRPTDPAPFETLYAEQGRIHEMRAAGGECTVTLTVPADVSVRTVVEAFAASHPETSLAARRTVTEPTESPDEFRAQLDETWTDRQREAISAALHSGLYEWPRDTSVSTLADAFDVSSPTFQYHLRAAERKLLELALK